jgi:hypothetical protein
VPDSFAVTPNGYFHPSCVREVKRGEALLDGGRIRHVDGNIETVAACQFPHYSMRGEVMQGAISPSITHSWIVSESTTTSTSYGELTAQWVVPSAPTSADGEIIFYFPGMEDNNDIVTIIQPVLQYGASSAGGGNYWSIASWNCCASGTTYFSSLVNVNSGDTILGTMRSTCAAGVLSCGSWNITTEDVTTGGSTTLSGSPSQNQTFNWAFAGALEVYNVAQCSDYPPGAQMHFTALALYDYNFNQVATPAWSLNSWAAGETPQCNYGGLVNNAAEVTLYYGPHLGWLPAMLGLLLH